MSQQEIPVDSEVEAARPEDHPSVNQPYSPQWNQPTRQLVSFFLVVGGIYALTLLAPVVQMLIIAFIIAFVMYAPSRWLYRRAPLPWALAVLIAYVVMIFIFIIMILVLVPLVVDGFNSLRVALEVTYTNLAQTLTDYEPEQGIIRVLDWQVNLNPYILPLRDFVLGAETPTGENLTDIDLQQLLESVLNVAGTVTSTVTYAITTVTGLVISVLLALIVSLLILLDMPRNDATLGRWVPPVYHREVRLLIRRVGRVWDRFFRGQVIIGVIIGLLTWAQLSLMGISSAIFLSIITGLVALIPTVGGFIALIPLTLIPLLQGSSSMPELSNASVALLVVVVNLLITQFVWSVVAPKILGDVLDLPLPVIIVGVFIGAAAGGVLGAFLVAPVMGTIRVLLLYTLSKLSGQDPFPGET